MDQMKSQKNLKINSNFQFVLSMLERALNNIFHLTITSQNLTLKVSHMFLYISEYYMYIYAHTSLESLLSKSTEFSNIINLTHYNTIIFQNM